MSQTNNTNIVTVKKTEEQKRLEDEVFGIEEYDKNEDYLKEDELIPNQQFCCVSFVEPHADTVVEKMKYIFKKYMEELFSDNGVKRRERLANYCKMSSDEKKEVEIDAGGNLFKEELESWIGNKMEDLTHHFKRDNPEMDGVTVRGLKVRGTFPNVKLAKRHADKLSRDDETFNIFVGEVGKWIPFNPININDVKPEYFNEQLNQVVHGHMNQKELTKQHYKERKNHMAKRNKVLKGRRGARKLVVDAQKDAADRKEAEATGTIIEEEPEEDNANVSDPVVSTTDEVDTGATIEEVVDETSK